MLRGIASGIVDQNPDGVETLARAAVAAGVSPQQILDHALAPSMEVVGERFGSGEIFLPELLMAGEAMKAAMSVLEPLLSSQESGTHYRGKAAIGTVQGDVHDIGKNIVIMLLKGSGWEVIDLGVDVPPEDFCRAVEETGCQILGLSALLTTTMSMQARVIEALKEAGLRDKVKVAIGGAVCTQAFADKIGADVFAADAAEAVRRFGETVPRANP
jgi:5-methyltetrahydrofolate--homocysteine methyltransferase